MYSPYTKITCILTSLLTSSEQFLRAIWEPVSQAIVLILPQIRLNSQLSHCSFLFSQHLPVLASTLVCTFLQRRMSMCFHHVFSLSPDSQPSSGHAVLKNPPVSLAVVILKEGSFVWPLRLCNLFLEGCAGFFANCGSKVCLISSFITCNFFLFYFSLMVPNHFKR